MQPMKPLADFIQWNPPKNTMFSATCGCTFCWNDRVSTPHVKYLHARAMTFILRSNWINTSINTTINLMTVPIHHLFEKSSFFIFLNKAKFLCLCVFLYFCFFWSRGYLRSRPTNNHVWPEKFFSVERNLAGEKYSTGIEWEAILFRWSMRFCSV